MYQQCNNFEDLIMNLQRSIEAENNAREAASLKQKQKN